MSEMGPLLLNNNDNKDQTNQHKHCDDDELASRSITNIASFVIQETIFLHYIYICIFFIIDCLSGYIYYSAQLKKKPFFDVHR